MNSNDDISALKADVISLTKELNHLKEENSKIKELNEKLCHMMDKLINAKNVHKNENETRVKALEDENIKIKNLLAEKYQNKIKEMTLKINEDEIKIKELKDTVIRMQNKSNSPEVKMNQNSTKKLLLQCKHKIKELMKEKEDKDKKIKYLQENLLKFQDQNQSNSINDDLSINENFQLKQQIKELEVKNQNLSAKYEKKIKSLEEKLVLIQNQILNHSENGKNELKIENSLLKQKIQELEIKNQHLATKYKQKIKALDENISLINNKIKNQSNNENLRLNQKINELNNENKNLKNKVKLALDELNKNK